MPKPWRLTRRAESALTDIARWTIETFGPRQAAAYEDDLIATCRGIAEGTALSQTCRQLIDPNLPGICVLRGQASISWCSLRTSSR